MRTNARGAFRAQAAFTTTCEACEPSRETGFTPYTRSPTAKAVTRSPTATIVPAKSLPSVIGNRDAPISDSSRRPYPSARRTSIGFTEAASTATSISPAAGLPRGNSRISKPPPAAGPRHIAATRVDGLLPAAFAPSPRFASSCPFDAPFDRRAAGADPAAENGLECFGQRRGRFGRRPGATPANHACSSQRFVRRRRRRRVSPWCAD